MIPGANPSSITRKTVKNNNELFKKHNARLALCPSKSIMLASPYALWKACQPVTLCTATSRYTKQNGGGFYSPFNRPREHIGRRLLLQKNRQSCIPKGNLDLLGAVPTALWIGSTIVSGKKKTKQKLGSIDGAHFHSHLTFLHEVLC